MFSEYLTRSGLSRADLAKELGISRITLWRLENAKQRPSLELAVNIEKLAGIPASAWPKSEAPKRATKDASPEATAPQ